MLPSVIHLVVKQDFSLVTFYSCVLQLHLRLAAHAGHRRPARHGAPTRAMHSAAAILRLALCAQARARQLGAYMQAQISTEEERRMAETFRTPEAVMKETAVSDFLPGSKAPNL